MSTVRLVAKIAMAAQRLHAKAKPWEGECKQRSIKCTKPMACAAISEVSGNWWDPALKIRVGKWRFVSSTPSTGLESIPTDC
ncbi:hypothetical protein Ptr902_08221 [Pyrenophora tritici-repentis]|nr:hypothetical protein Alg215_03451 [Pyrenophora tritici-repentis]KAI0612327.1 hypothetical protein TUN205_03437 [Pyrenophora tritici-repentis]KAI2480040.1 hypothetical protein Ptr902_08221 [Pyrenophora tritici-repentis]